jgi:hypothetical protein
MIPWLRFLVAGALVLATLPAAANGRFPRAQRLLEDQTDANHLVLAATYGLLVTSDRGASWHHVCEAAFGENDLSVDALTALTSEGALLAGIYSGVSRAARQPCDFTRTLGMNNRQAVPDFALVAGSPGRVLAILVALPEQGEPYSQLYQSEDDGQSWEPLGGPLPEELKTPLTIDVAPTDSNRVYLSGLDADESGVLLRSDDGGESFVSFPIPTDAASFENPYIAAVDPTNAERVYVRTDLWAYDVTTSTATGNDALLISENGGAEFTVAARAAGKLLGFAFSPDGSEYLLGFGDPREAGGGRMTEPDALGIYRASTSGGSLAKIYAGSVGCLSWTEQGLYVCTHESDTGFSLGFSADTEFDLETPPELEPLLVLADVVGPVECEGCSNGAICQAYWAPTCQAWGRRDCVEQDAPRCEGGASGEAGRGVTADAGAGASGSGGAASGGAGEASRDPISESNGCGCRSANSAGAAATPFALLTWVGLLSRRRRSR